MAADDEIYRGFVQHRRTYNNDANGNGQPRTDDILEGEIAINLRTRKVYSKRTKDSDESFGQTITAVLSDVGARLVFFGRTEANGDEDYELFGQTITISDTAVTGSDLATAFQTELDAITGATAIVRPDFPNEVLVDFDTTQFNSENFSDLRDRIDFAWSATHKITHSAGFAIAINDEIAYYSTGEVVAAVTSGVVARTDGSSLFVTNFSLDPDQFGISRLNGLVAYSRTRSDSEEIILLNNLPEPRATFPENPTFGDLAISTDPDRRGLFWYDDSRVNDTGVQSKIRADLAATTNDSDFNAILFNRNLVRTAGDSDKDPNAEFAEWRAFVSPELIDPEALQIVTGNIEYTDRVLFDRGSSYNDGNTNYTIDTNRTDATFNDGLYNVQSPGIGIDPRFFVYDSDGNVIDQFVTRNNILAMNMDLNPDGFLLQNGQNFITGQIAPLTALDFGSSMRRFSTIWATTFDGTATQARYADLAEKYLADDEYEPGTVIAVGGEAEVTAATLEQAHSVIGVVSTNPAHLMNSGLEGGTAIALKGRVPVKVVGLVQKGDRLVASQTPGFAEVDNGHQFGFAIALEDGTDVVEAIIL